MRIRPILENINIWTKSAWKVERSMEIATLPRDFLLLEFNQEEDMVWVLDNGP